MRQHHSHEGDFRPDKKFFVAGLHPEARCRLAGVLLARADYAQLLHCPDLSDGTWHEVPLPQAHDMQTCNDGVCAVLYPEGYDCV